MKLKKFSNRASEPAAKTGLKLEASDYKSSGLPLGQAQKLPPHKLKYLRNQTESAVVYFLRVTPTTTDILSFLLASIKRSVGRVPKNVITTADLHGNSFLQ